jgi:hypothetical protein
MIILDSSVLALAAEASCGATAIPNFAPTQEYILRFMFFSFFLHPTRVGLLRAGDP